MKVSRCLHGRLPRRVLIASCRVPVDAEEVATPAIAWSGHGTERIEWHAYDRCEVVWRAKGGSKHAFAGPVEGGVHGRTGAVRWVDHGVEDPPQRGYLELER